MKIEKVKQWVNGVLSSRKQSVKLWIESSKSKAKEQLKISGEQQQNFSEQCKQSCSVVALVFNCFDNSVEKKFCKLLKQGMG